jgi:hypothetical protein
MDVVVYLSAEGRQQGKAAAIDKTAQGFNPLFARGRRIIDTFGNIRKLRFLFDRIPRI